MNLRPMDFAGNWYPSGQEACARKIRTLMSGTPETVDVTESRLGIVPHAGWLFSGALAASVFGALQGGSEVPLVIVLGGHLGVGDPIIAMTEGGWETPLGSFRIHQGFRAALEKFPSVVWETPHRYQQDNSTELQLPFAKFCFPQAELLPIRVPPSGIAVELGRALGDYLADHAPDAVVVASTDLTHYGPGYGFEPHGRGEAALRWVKEENDPAFMSAVGRGEAREVLETARLYRNACSPGAVAAAMEIAAQGRKRFEAIGYASSADIGPRDKENFVGYMGGVFGA